MSEVRDNSYIYYFLKIQKSQILYKVVIKLEDNENQIAY